MKILENRLNYNSSTTLGGKASRVKVKSKLDTRISIILHNLLHGPTMSYPNIPLGSPKWSASLAQTIASLSESLRSEPQKNPVVTGLLGNQHEDFVKTFVFSLVHT